MRVYIRIVDEFSDKEILILPEHSILNTDSTFEQQKLSMIKSVLDETRIFLNEQIKEK